MGNTNYDTAVDGLPMLAHKALSVATPPLHWHLQLEPSICQRLSKLDYCFSQICVHATRGSVSCLRHAPYMAKHTDLRNIECIQFYFSPLHF